LTQSNVNMGASASTRHFFPSGDNSVPKGVVDFYQSNKLHALQLIFLNKDICRLFKIFVGDVEVDKLLFVKFYLELERLRAVCFTTLLDKRLKGVMTIGDSLQTVRDIVLNSSAKIYLLIHPSRRIHEQKKTTEFHYEGVIAQCLSPLLSSTALLSEVGLQRYHEMLENCQTNLLMELLEELSDFIISPVFLQLQTCSNNAAVRNTFAEIVQYTSEKTAVVEHDADDKEEKKESTFSTFRTCGSYSVDTIPSSSPSDPTTSISIFFK